MLGTLFRLGLQRAVVPGRQTRSPMNAIDDRVSRASGGIATGAFLVALLAGSATGQEFIETDRPGVTFSPWTLAPCRSQIELGTPNFAVTRGNGRDEEAWNTPFLLRHGISDHAEVRLLGSGWNWLTGASGGSDTMSGFGDLEIGAKLVVSRPDGWVPRSALIAGVQLPTGTEEFSADEPGYDVSWTGEWYPSDHDTWRVTLGAMRQSFDEGFVTTGAAALRYQRRFDDRWSSHAEIGVFPGLHGARDQAVWGVGVELRLTKDVKLDLAGDFALNDDTPDADVTAGVSIRF